MLGDAKRVQRVFLFLCALDDDDELALDGKLGKIGEITAHDFLVKLAYFPHHRSVAVA